MELARLAASQPASQPASKQLCRALFGPQSNRGHEVEKKCHHPIRDGFPQLSLEQLFFGRTPTWSETVSYWDFGPFWAAGTDKIPGLGEKQKKRHFPVLGVPKWGKKIPRCPGWLSAAFLQFTFLSTRPPRAGNHEIRGFWAIFGLGRPLALR